MNINIRIHQRKIVFFGLMIILNYLYGSASTNCSESRPHPNADYLGLGYNIIKGNPDGEPGITSDVDSGLDPGFNLIRIIDHSYEKCTMENEHLVPDDVLYLPRSITAGTCKAYAIYGSRSYEKELSFLTTIEAGLSVLFTGFKFGASAGFKEFSSRFETGKYLYVTLRNLKTYGQGQIQPGYTLRPEFTTRLCALPTEYLGNEGEYHEFLDLWGTHVVMGATFGQSEHISIQYKLSEVMEMETRKISGSLYIGGMFKGYSASIVFPLSRDLKFEDFKGAAMGSRRISLRGSRENNEPITYRLKGMDKITEDSPCNRTETLVQNMRQALDSYPQYLGIPKSDDPTVFKLPLTWPDGRYTLPKSVNGCPEGDVSWAQGSRLFDTRNDNLENRWEPDDIHLDLPIKEPSRIKMNFCTKTSAQSADYQRDWGPGTYCIFRSGNVCPKGFRNGSIFWNELNLGNDNDHEGILPDGEYDSNTKMYFCCREDADSNKPLILPVDHDFFLMTPSGNCQKVLGMGSKKEVLHWDTVGLSEVEGLHPYPGRIRTLKDVEIVNCHYKRDNTSDIDADSSRSDRRRRSMAVDYDQGPCSNFQDVVVPYVPGVVFPGQASTGVLIRIDVMILILSVCIAFAL